MGYEFVHTALLRHRTKIVTNRNFATNDCNALTCIRESFNKNWRVKCEVMWLEVIVGRSSCALPVAGASHRSRDCRHNTRAPALL